jgi:hypothetical protein
LSIAEKLLSWQQQSLTHSFSDATEELTLTPSKIAY